MSVENPYQQFYTVSNNFTKTLEIIPEPVNIPDYIVIEGTSGAGKTTTINIVERETIYPHIGEYGNYVNFPEGETFPQFPPKCVEDIIRTNTFWTKLEFRRRAHQLFSQTQSPGEIQIVERSPVSLFAFEYAKMQQGIPFEFNHLLGLYSKLYKAGVLKEPNGYVFIKVSSPIVQERIKYYGTNPTLEFLCLDKTIYAINQFIGNFLAEYINPDRFIILDSDSRSQEELAKEVIEFINKLKGKKQQTNGISSLAHNVLIGKSIF